MYCDQPGGPWSDPDIFWDEDGRTYFVTQGDAGIRITEIDIKTGRVRAPERLVWAGTGGRFPEAPHIYKKDGYYYLILGEGGTEYAHSTTIGCSRQLWGHTNPAP
ncbi:MAG: family 43 glycosylhydrolase [Massilibacteroides sp.]|nr:family 43 glycosylhydrolase [Massilibacteroides sp.]MDD4660399.1 family 43 glycosylhydrolase [Massilibacteroides sp.]